MEPIVECRGVSKRYGERLAVDGLDLAVPPRACFGLLGPNGAGKTTTLRMIYGVAKPDEGEVRVFGLDVAREARRVRARLGVTLQEDPLIEDLTPVENLRIFARYHRLPRDRADSRIEELLDWLDLRSHAALPVRALSGGFRRRLAIALSLVAGPELLILDEPTTGLDPAVRLSLWGRIRELCAGGTTVLLTTHYMEEAERLCDRIAILAGGKRVAEGAPRELVREVLAREALEIEATPAEEAEWMRGLADVRRLRVGSRLFLYVDDAGALHERLRPRLAGTHRAFVARPAHLEDVFLALTGTRLEGGA